MRQVLTIFLILILGGGTARAQVLTPLNSLPPQAISVPAYPSKPGSTPQPLASGDTLSLPFLDDFAKSEGNPDPARWVSRGGVSVTNRYSANSPSIFAATFDGLKADGQPYGTSTGVGPTDTLTSKPLDLGSLQIQDSVYLSFYWQSGGLLDAPDFSSSSLFSLQLEFKEANGTWTSVWTQKGNGRSTDFAPVMVAFRESRYLYNGFQFRWVSSGRLSGLRDVWHVDYVYLDSNRLMGQLQTFDVTLTQRIPSLLQRYTAMPIWQFLENPVGETRPEVGSEMVNLSNVPAALSWRALVRNLTTGVVDTFLRGSAPMNAGTKTPIAAAPSSSFLASQNQGYSLETMLFLNTKEPNFYTRYNDTLRRQTDLLDFYAYDDGSAETGFSYPSGTAVQLAYQYDLNKPDRIKAVRIFFTGTNTPGTELFLRLWTDNNGKPSDQPVYEQRFVLPALTSLNNWLEITLERQLEVQGRFYVGYRQPTSGTFVNVGFDLNENADGKLFAMNGATAWATVPNLGGALLIRPVMTGTLTASPGDLVSSEALLYPNPSETGDFYLNQASDQLQLYSLTGQLLKSWKNVPKGQRMVLPPGLPAGIYFVKAQKGSQLRTAKLIYQK
ncbi:T9SS type A sorting domain-containing protein [Rufibacter latericius]|uniref:T9SS C-terminal target domain-containing protein n=1 Tax=Rufibacter latericius TaxID=2487040 RepID=A0A3M9MAN5_9BACT|nr:T9SS type A sorting domain-containing protein [Rufibacter latericius]RNI22629.1 T9SS C-terminal target domain-containing protein [Rufibacter latericius]